jgi:hypothetical protein
MKLSYHKIGSAIYVIWGIIHIFGGGTLLADAVSDNPTKALFGFGSAMPESSISPVSDPVTASVISFHSFDLVWMGILVTIIAITMNWKNSKTGFLINTAIIAFADLGLIIFMLIPGIVKVEEGLIGPLLLPLGMIFLILGLRKKDKAKTTSIN